MLFPSFWRVFGEMSTILKPTEEGVNKYPTRFQSKAVFKCIICKYVKFMLNLLNYIKYIKFINGFIIKQKCGTNILSLFYTKQL